MEEQTIKIGRLRPIPYILNCKNEEGILKRYEWAGSKNGKVVTKNIPKMIVEDLVITSQCFNDGELVIMEEKEEIKKDIIENIDNPEKYENNTNSREEIVKILNGTITNMKKELNKIEVIGEKQFVINVAKEIKLDSKAKLKFLAEWMGIEEDILFEE